MTLATAGVDWYAARAGGVVAYILLSTVVILGLALAGKERLRNWPRFAVEDVHRFGGLLVGCFVLAPRAHDRHRLRGACLARAGDRPVQRRPTGPLWTGLGTVAAELLLALALANRYRSGSRTASGAACTT